MYLKNYTFNEPIYTYGELTKYIGRPVYLWYKYPEFHWIITVEMLKTNEFVEKPNGDINNVRVSQLDIYATNALQVLCNGNKEIKFIHDYDHHGNFSCSSAQRYCRTLTEEEFEMYRKITRPRRLGFKPNI